MKKITIFFRTHWRDVIALAGFIFVAVVVARFATHFPDGISRETSVAGIKQWAGEYADITTYLRYAEDLLDNGKLEEWFPSCFPPGMAVIDGFLMKAFGTERFVATLQGFGTLTWGICLFFFYLLVGGSRRGPFLFLLINLFWLLPSSRDWALGYGSLMSESRAHPLFLLALSLCAFGIRERRDRFFFAGAVMLGLCGYVRVYFEKTGLFIFGLLVLIELYRFFTKRGSKEELRRSLIAFGLFHLVLFPWSLRNRIEPRIKVYGMAPAQMHITFYHLWESTEATPGILGAGANTACLTDPPLCQRLHAEHGRVIPDGISKREAIKTLLSHPVTWFQLRTQHLMGFWIGVDRSFGYLFEAFLTLAAWLAGLFASVVLWRKAEPEKRLFAAFAIGFCLFNLAVFTFAGMDIDGRHSVTIRFFALFSGVWLLVLSLRKWPKVC